MKDPDAKIVSRLNMEVHLGWHTHNQPDWAVCKELEIRL